MDCLKETCPHYAYEKNNFCTISNYYILSDCPIERMIRYYEDRLEGLKQIRKYLEKAAP
jgi:hypothetical protein